MSKNRCFSCGAVIELQATGKTGMRSDVHPPNTTVWMWRATRVRKEGRRAYCNPEARRADWIRHLPRNTPYMFVRNDKPQEPLAWSGGSEAWIYGECDSRLGGGEES